MNSQKRLYLLRHAKAVPGDATTADHDRPLAPEGAAAASQVGRHIAAKGGALNLILCSTALRTKETAALVASEVASQSHIAHERSLYLCGADALLRRLHAVGPERGSVMIVAHNPDLHELAISLAATGDARRLAALRTKFPTGALAVLTVDVHAWSALRPGGARLDDFVVPDDLNRP